MTKQIPIHVVGGGIAGLVAAITAADGGAPVVLHEASDTLGGRARSGAGPYGVNLGPHVLYANGAVVEFLKTRGLRKQVRLKPPTNANMVVLDADGRHSPLRIAGAVAAVVRPRRAPVDQRFDEWAHDTFSARHAADLCHLAGLYTFHHDPGSLSAAFVWNGCVRSIGRFHNVRYVQGGWTSLVDPLVGAVRRRGVRIELGSRLEPGDLPADGPVIVATASTAAASLLDRDLAWPTARTALFDVALDHSRPDSVARHGHGARPRRLHHGGAIQRDRQDAGPAGHRARAGPARRGRRRPPRGRHRPHRAHPRRHGGVAERRGVAPGPRGGRGERRRRPARHDLAGPPGGRPGRRPLPRRRHWRHPACCPRCP